MGQGGEPGEPYTINIDEHSDSGFRTRFDCGLDAQSRPWMSFPDQTPPDTSNSPFLTLRVPVNVLVSLYYDGVLPNGGETQMAVEVGGEHLGWYRIQNFAPPTGHHDDGPMLITLLCMTHGPEPFTM